MFSRKNRIPRQDLEEVLKHGKSVAQDFFNIKYSKNNLPHPRFAVIVSKKVTKSSVARHKMKRRYVSMVRSTSDKINSFDVVIFPRKESNQKDFKTLKANFSSFIDKNSL